ncbi:unnamed protein product, partial [Iphiclides podalirius]
MARPNRCVCRRQKNGVNHVSDLRLEVLLEDCNLGLKALFNTDLESTMIITKLWKRTALYQPPGPPRSNYPPVIPINHEQTCRIIEVIGRTQTLYQKNYRKQMLMKRQYKKNPKEYNGLSDGDVLRELKSA